MRFIHFGCWNKGLCDITQSNETSNGLTKTMKLLNKYVSENDINFVTIAGDNYYPDKNKATKEKTMNLENFLSGINCLPKDIRKYVLLGNHEYDNIKINDTINRCELLQLERENFNDKNNSIFFTDIQEIKLTNSIIILIDTTIYEVYEENRDIDIKDTCFPNAFNIHDENKKTLIDLIKYQTYKVTKILSENLSATNIIIIGHHPIISIKEKEKDKKIVEKENITEGLIMLFQNLKSLLSRKNIYYLCADTHNYQQGIVTIEDDLQINQYICGTGGADQDNCSKKKETVIDKHRLRYIINECKKEFGFLDVSESGDRLELNFISTESMVGGYYTKYLKYKHKYINLQKKLNIL